MPTIQEVRSQYPQYNDMNDGQLADALHTKFYSDMDKTEFNKKIGLSYSPELKQEIKDTGVSLAKETARFGTEMAGLVGGGIKGAAYGTAVSPGVGTAVGAAVGAGLGYAAVKSGEKLTEGETLTGMGLAKDTVEGAAMETTGQGVGSVIGRTGNFFRNRTDTGLTKVYEKFGVKPLPSEALLSPSKTLSIMESVLGYSPASGTVMSDYAVTRLAHLNNIRAQLVSKGASETELAKIGNNIRDEATVIVQRYRKGASQNVTGMVDDFMNLIGAKGETKYIAGTNLKELLADNLANRKTKIKEMYDSVDDALGMARKEKISISQETQDAATELYKLEMSKPSAYRNQSLLNRVNAFVPKLKDVGEIVIGGTKYTPEQVLQMPDAFRKATGLVPDKITPAYRWDGLKGARTALNEEISKIYKETGGKGNNEARVYQILANSIDDEMEKFAASKGDDIWDIYKQARSESATMHELFDKDTLRIMNSKPQDILQRVVSKNDVGLIRQIKETVGNAGIEPLKKAYFGDAFDRALTEVTDKTAARYLTLDTNVLKRQIAKLSPEMQAEIASTGELQTVKNIIDKADIINLKTFGKGKKEALQFLDTLVGTSNEKIVNVLFKPENPRNIKLAKMLLSPTQLTNVQEAALNQVMKTTADGNFLPVSTAREIKRYYTSLKELVGESATNDIMDFVKVTGNMKKVEQMAQNTSQTGQVFVGYDIMKQLLNTPLRAMKTLGTPWVVAKIYTSDVARNYLKKAIMYPANNPDAISNFAKALITAFKIGVTDEK